MVSESNTTTRPQSANSANLSMSCGVVRIRTSDVDHSARWARLQNRPKDDVHNRRDAGKEQRHQRHNPPQAAHIEIKLVRQPSAHARDHLLIATSIQIAHAEYYTIAVY